MRRQSLLVCLLAGMLVAIVAAQDSQRLEFEVATVKPVDRSAPVIIETIVYPGGRLVIRAASLATLVSSAYGVSAWQVSGGETWMRQDLYAIEAKPSPEMQSRITNLRTTWTGVEDTSLKLMLQSLLRDRFKLDVRRESATGTVYTLERNGQPLRLKEAVQREARGGNSNLGTAGYAGGRWVIGGMSMEQLAGFASNLLRAPVRDQTGLEGAFDYRQAEPDVDPKYGDQQFSQESFLRMIPELGLRLRRTEGLVDKFVIVAAQRPLEN